MLARYNLRFIGDDYSYYYFFVFLEELQTQFLYYLLKFIPNYRKSVKNTKNE